jgi:hypothetical protein
VDVQGGKEYDKNGKRVIKPKNDREAIFWLIVTGGDGGS